MADEDLTASHWGDVFSGTSSNVFGSTMPNILRSDEFAPPSFDEDNHSENLTDQESKQAEEEEEVESQTEAEKLESKFKTSTLLSSLTKDVDDSPLNASTLGGDTPEPVKGNALFETLVLADSKFKAFGADESIDNSKAVSKPSSSPIKMYKAARVRRYKPSATAGHKQKALDESLSKSDENLGPLGDVLRDSSAVSGTEKRSLTPSEQLVNSAEAPLYSRDSHKKLTENPNISQQIGEYFQNKDSQVPKPLLKRPQQDANLTKFDINVGDPTKVGDIASAHIVYTIRTVTAEGVLSSTEVVVTRRYKDFRWLYHQLQANNPGYIIPPPPLKQAVGRFNEQFVENRRFSLERMLQKISQSAVLQKDSDFLMFLQSTSFAGESKEREKITGSGASNGAVDDYDLSSSSSGSGGSAGGLMSAIGGAFSSFASKVVDTDDFFNDQKVHVEDLDLQLKAFYRNFELICQQRNELSSVTEEFANAVNALAEIETSKSTSVLLSQFSQTQMRIKELLERQSMQDLITLGSVLDEYIRLLGSIRSVFLQRHKALALSSNSDYELNKKQQSMDKFIKNHRNQVDKIETLKKEVATYETKSLNLKVKFDDISQTIKKELARFQFDKIDDFRNAIETFLESLIESQKEAIELWETFYDRQKLDEIDDVKLDEQIN